MRLRNIPGAHDILKEHSHVVKNPKDYKGKWNTYFGNDNPIHIEIGMGKGQFITTLALQNPHINYIGFEKFTNVLVRGLKKIDQHEDLDNLAVIRMDAEEILDVFEQEEIARIYLNFSDPWPKDRHAKRRLTYKNFLEKYKITLTTHGDIHFKTDNKSLFEFSINQFKENGWEIEMLTYDLHNSPYIGSNVMTEYEERYIRQGMPIYKSEARKKS